MFENNLKLVIRLSYTVFIVDSLKHVALSTCGDILLISKRLSLNSLSPTVFKVIQVEIAKAVH